MGLNGSIEGSNPSFSVSVSDWRDEFRRTSHANWEATAPGWDRVAEGVEETAEEIRAWMLEALDPQPGQTVLELAAGAGFTGF